MSTSSLSLDSQVKTLIPADEEVDLPIDSAKHIFINTSFTETLIQTDTLVPLFAKEIRKALNPSQYHLIDSGLNYLEVFIVFPCRAFNIENIQEHEIIHEGVVTSSLYIDFKSDEYDITLKDFEWVDKKRNRHNLDQLFHRYRRLNDLKEKVKYYGILKSAEISITETISNLTLILEEIIKVKSSKQSTDKK